MFFLVVCVKANAEEGVVFGDGWRADGGDVDVVGFEVFRESQGGLGGVNEDGDDRRLYKGVVSEGLKTEAFENGLELSAALVEFVSFVVHRGQAGDGVLGLE